MPGQENLRQNISAITQAIECQVTTASTHGYSTGDFIRFTDLNGSIPVNRGMFPLNNNRYSIWVDSTTTFLIRDPISNEYIDSTNFPAYVEGGFCNYIEPNFIYEGD